MNRLAGRIAAVEAHGSVALVDVTVGDCRFSATLLGIGADAAAWQPGRHAHLLFKETEVALAKNLSGLISLRNRMKGIVTAIEHGRLLSRVTFQVEGHAISSVITTRSLALLELELGDEIEGLVKANEMNVMPEPLP